MSMTLLAAMLAGAYAIQPPGQFHGDEPVARDGERWLALRVDGGDAALVATQVQVRRVHDALVDAPGAATGAEIGSALGDGVVAFLRGPALREGGVEPAQVMPGGDAAMPTPRYALRFRNVEFGIETRCSPKHEHTRDTQQMAYDCLLQLKRGTQVQTLATLRGYRDAGSAVVYSSDDGNARLLFAGDLDQDGRVDLIFDLSDHYNVSRPTLFLSSQAGPGELLRPVAQYESVGC
jgi:hypothetical protein